MQKPSSRHHFSLWRSLLLSSVLASTVATAQQTAMISEIAVFPERDAPASVLAANESKIAAEVSGQIIELTDAVGGVVAKGAIIARIDARDYELALARARAALEASQARLVQAESQLTRAKDLQAKNFLSADALIQRETEASVQRADVKLNQAQVATAERTLAKCIIRAPFAAVVKARLAQGGELAAPGTPLLSLVEAGRTELTAQIQPRDLASVKAARSIKFSAGAQDAATRLLRVSPLIGRETRTVEARLAAGRELAPGLEGRITWLEQTPHIPPAYLQRKDGKLGIYLADGQKFIPLADAQEGRPAAVPAGLATSTRLMALPPLPAAAQK